MKLLDSLLFSFAILFMLIGIHQAMEVGYASSYWLFMLALVFLFAYQVRKKAQHKEGAKEKAKTMGKEIETNAKKRKYKM